MGRRRKLTSTADGPNPHFSAHRADYWTTRARAAMCSSGKQRAQISQWPVGHGAPGGTTACAADWYRQPHHALGERPRCIRRR